MAEAIAEPPPTVDEAEAFKVLLARVGRKSPKIPAEVLVRHVMACVPSSEWPVRVEALDALLRRLDSGRSDRLHIETRPEDGSVLGWYSTRRKTSDVRPYRTMLCGVDPIEGRCDCPDFLKNSLAVCKHLLVLLEQLYGKPRLLRRALKEQGRASGPIVTGLRWDPIRPLTGPGDWLERVAWSRPPDPDGPLSERTSRALRWFRAGAAGELVLDRSYQDDPAKRLELVEDLFRVIPAGVRGQKHDPALRALLLHERERLKRKARLVLAPEEREAAIGGLKRPPYPYQREGVDRFLAEGRLLLADDMGLGKTAQAIAATEVLWRSKRIRRALIIAPASLKPQWAREWAAFSELPIHVIDGSPAERQAVYETRRSGLFIINYEQLIRDLETIRAWDPDLVVLDEAQRIKNWATKTALSVKGLSPTYRLVLTGTPMENRIEELASVVEWVDDMALEPKWRLGALHAVHADGRHDVIGVRNLDTLRQRLRGCMVRRVRQDVLDQLPPRTDTRVPVEFTDAQAEEHDALIAPIASLAARARTRPLTQVEFLRLMSLLTTQRIISNGLAQLNFEEVWPSIRNGPPEESVIKGLSSPKLLEFRQLIRQLVLEQGRKVVAFSQWRRMLTLAHWVVRDLLEEGGYRAGFFTGLEGQRRRTQNIVEFHDDPNFRLLFATDAGGVGLNLQHASNCVINLELPWNPAVLEQRIGRVYRLGQKRPIDAYNLVSEEGIESRILDLVGSKQAFFKGLFDGASDTVQFEQSSSFLSKVERLYETEVQAAPNGAQDDDLGEIDLSDDGLDDDVDDPFEPILDAADESRDGLEAANAADRLETASSASQGPAADTGIVVTRPSEIAPTTDRDGSLPLPGAGEVRQLFSQLQIRRQEDGRVVIEAPAEAASLLGALFEGMAAMLQAASGPRNPEAGG